MTTEARGVEATDSSGMKKHSSPAGDDRTSRGERRPAPRTQKLAARWLYRRMRSKSARRWTRRLGWDHPATVTTFTSSMQATPLDPLLTSTRDPQYGHIYGMDLLTLQPSTGGVQALYDAGVIQSPLVAILGALGVRKSTTAKTQYALRPLALGTRVAVFDRKQQREGSVVGGEYTRLARIVPGSQVVVLHRDPKVGTRINPLDPAIAAITSESSVGQDELLRMVTQSAMSSQLSPEQGYALTAAHHAARKDAEDAGRVPILSDVVQRLYAPSLEAVPGPRDADGRPVLDDLGIVDVARVTEWGLTVALSLERFLKGDLSGIIDGPTSGPGGEPVDLSAPLLVIDTSALAEGSAVLGLVMAVISTYLMSRWSTVQGYKHLILEEGYSADKWGGVPDLLRALAKRSRGVGATIVAIFHHISDVPETSPLYTLIKESGVAHIFRQDKPEDAEAAVRMFNLPPSMVQTVQTLRPGVNVWIRGNLPPTLAAALRTPLEAWVTDTDAAMRIGDPAKEAASAEL